jgi:hypothetical protein
MRLDALARDALVSALRGLAAFARGAAAFLATRAAVDVLSAIVLAPGFR